MESADEADATRASREAQTPQSAGEAAPGESSAHPPADAERDELDARIEELRARVRAANRLSLAGPDSPSLGPPSGQNDGGDTRA